MNSMTQKSPKDMQSRIFPQRANDANALPHSLSYGRGSALLRATVNHRRKLPRMKATNGTEKDKLEIARKYYEGAWSTSNSEEFNELIDTLLAEDHVQEDRVWQGQPSHGRESMRKGIQFIRSWYPDARFVVEKAALTEDGKHVFVQWSMTGTYEGTPDSTSGIALLTISNNQISRTQNYRQALKAEIEVANKRLAESLAKGERSSSVPQAAMLTKSSGT